MDIQTLQSFVGEAWVTGTGALAPLFNPATGEELARAGTGGIDLGAALDHARNAGPALRELTFAQRGAALRAISKALHAHRDELIQLAIANGGNTRSDAKFDIDGAIATLAHYGELGEKLGSLRVLRDGEAVQLGRTARYAGVHLWVPREGVAVHINAFNFPAWGMGEKLACAWLAGMPAISKPATSSALVAFRAAQLIAETRALPPGSFSFLCGSAGDLLDRLHPNDVVAFTGGASTAKKLREQLAPRGVRLNVEADSLNSALLGPDVEPGSASWDLFVADVARDMTQKAGQKCTAIRRVFIPAERLDAVGEALIERLTAVKVGNPALPEVTMGPLATKEQQADIRAGLSRLLGETESLFGGSGQIEPLGASADKGCFVGPTLLLAKDPHKAEHLHRDEVFGPASTLCTLRPGSAAEQAREAVGLIRRGGGSLVCSVFTDDRAFAAQAVLGLAPAHGRVYLGSEKVAGQTFGPGTVLPQMVHGGPGHAGGGEELGGLRGLGFYSQRTAVQGDRALLDAIAPAAAEAPASA